MAAVKNGLPGLKITEDTASRKEFVQGATGGGVLQGLAVGAILSRVLGGGRGARRRQR